MAAPGSHHGMSPRVRSNGGGPSHAAKRASAASGDSTPTPNGALSVQTQHAFSPKWTASVAAGRRQRNSIGCPSETGYPTTPRVDPTEQRRHGSTQVRRTSPHARPVSADPRASHEVQCAPTRQPLAVRSVQQPAYGSLAPQKNSGWSDRWDLSMLSPTKLDYRRENNPELQAVTARKTFAHWEASLCQAKQEGDLRELNNYPPYPDIDCVPTRFRLREVYTPELQSQSHGKAVEDWRNLLCAGKKDEDARNRRLRTRSQPPWLEQEEWNCSASSMNSTSAGSTVGASSRSSRGRSQPPFSPAAAASQERVEEVCSQIAELRRTTELQVQHILRENNFLGEREIAQITETLLGQAPAMPESPRAALALPTHGPKVGKPPGMVGSQTHRKARSPLQRLQMLAEIGEELQHLPTDKLKQRLAKVGETVQEALGCLDPGDAADMIHPHCEGTLDTSIRGTSFHNSKDKLRQRLARADIYAEETLANMRGASGDPRADFRMNEGVPPNSSRGSSSEAHRSACDKLRRRIARTEAYARDGVPSFGRTMTPESAVDTLDSGFLEAFEGLDGCIEEEPAAMSEGGFQPQEPCSSKAWKAPAPEPSHSLSMSSRGSDAPSSSPTLAAAASGFSEEGGGQPRPAPAGGASAASGASLDTASLLQAFSRMSPEELGLIASALGQHLPPSSR